MPTIIENNNVGDGDVENSDLPDLRMFVIALFFMFGGITSLNDIIIPKLKDLFTLNYTQALLVQSAFFGAYFLVSIPAAAIVRRAGYLRTASIGLLAMTAGCLLFVPASKSGLFGLFLLALFVLAAGITVVQVVANPLISLLGPARTAHSRLTFAQAFNSLGTTIFPFVGSILILDGLGQVDPMTLSGPALNAYRVVETQTVVNTYVGLAIALLITAIVVWSRRRRLHDVHDRTGNMLHALTLLSRPRFAFGALCIFLYVGAEVAIGSLIVNYLEQPDVMGLDPMTAGKHVTFYWGGALIGRFIGSAVLRLIPPGRTLAAVAAGAIILIATSANSHGLVSGYALLSVGLMNSIMFPTIFSIASERLGERAAQGSGVIATAIVGGAIIPPLTGMIADHSTLRMALVVPAICYLVIASYGFISGRIFATAAIDMN